MKTDKLSNENENGNNANPRLAPVYLKEKWFTHIRFYCKQGVIDRWMGDCINDPNNDTKSNMQLNSIATYWRLNGVGDWVNSRDMRDIYGLLVEFKDIATADEIWQDALNRC